MRDAAGEYVAPFAMQDGRELDAFCELIAREGAASYLEIGAKFGGSLWRVAQALKPGSRIVAVDLPRGTIAWPESEGTLRRCIERLCEQGHDAFVVWGDSTSREVVETVEAYGPFDVVLIDANHTDAYVRQDWANYGPMAKMVAFHDIGWKRPYPPEWHGVRIEVPALWAMLKRSHRHVEFCYDPKRKDNGIGVLWR